MKVYQFIGFLIAVSQAGAHLLGAAPSINNALLLASCGALVFVAFASSTTRPPWPLNRPLPFGNRLLVSVLATYVLVATLSMLLPTSVVPFDRAAQLGAGLWLIFLSMFFLTLRREKDPMVDVMDQLLTGLFWGALGTLVTALVFGEFTEGASRLTADYLSASMIGRNALLVIIVSLSRILTSRGQFLSLYGFALLLALGCIVLSFSKSSLVAVAVIVPAILHTANRFTYKVPWRKVGFVALLFGLSGLFFAERVFASVTQYLSMYQVGATLSGRTLLWSYILQLVRERPFVGYGFGATRELLTADNFPMFGVDAVQAHNAWVESVLNLGIVGTLPLLVAFAVTLSQLRRLRKRPLSDQSMRLFLQIVGIFFMLAVRGMTEASFAAAPNVEVFLLFFMVLGTYILGGVGAERRESTAHTQQVSTARR